VVAAPSPADDGDFEQVKECRSCGATNLPESEKCDACGKRFPPERSRDTGFGGRGGGGRSARGRGALGADPKSKGAAILLVFLFGPLGFLYTSEVDSKKCWIGLAISVLTLGLAGIFVTIYALVVAIGRSEDWYANYPDGDGAGPRGGRRSRRGDAWEQATPSTRRAGTRTR
jgi:hypothetical protein